MQKQELKEKQNLFKAKRQEMIAASFAQNPDLERVKKLIFNLLALGVASRVAHVVLQAVYVVVRSRSMSGFDIFASVLQVLVALFFASMILFGEKNFAGLAAFGGVYSLFNAFKEGVFSFLNTPDMFYNLVTWVFLAGVFIQIAVMAFLFLNGRANAYYKVIKGINKEMTDWMKSGSSEN